MRQVWSILAVCLLAAMQGVPASAEDDAGAAAPVVSCGDGVPGSFKCVPSKQDVKEAHTAYARGLKLEDRRLPEEAFAQFDQAARLQPQNAQFFSAREVARSQVVFRHTENGEAFLADSRPQEAAAEFRAALKLDPGNAYLQTRLEEALRDPRSSGTAVLPAQLADSTEIQLLPKEERATFHYSGDVRGLFTQLASAYG